MEGPRKKRAALAHTPPVPSYFKGLHDEDEEDEDDDDDDDDDRDRDPDEWLDSDEDEEQEKSAAHPGLLAWCYDSYAFSFTYSQMLVLMVIV